MPRSPRLLLPLTYYHIMTRGNNLNVIFRQSDDYLKYLEILHDLKEIHPFDMYHYCLMPNHTHFLVRTRSESDFSSFMKKINLIYFYYYKKKYGWVGHFWQGRFKSQPVGKDDYFIQCGRYIELNPLRANLVDDTEEYPYSSFHYYSKGKVDSLITEDLFYEELGKTMKERQLKYKDIIINDLVLDTYKKKAWGSKEQRYNEHRKIKYHVY
ncbi:hypothetical protein A3D77_02075 [Candidatus Gottesmanbacteria bacterium RIFCSPHIGHO2_02_FULL_39_11]|uniref:Transposase IS200-like domain-containing protein n=1 Tax=Candidatus Gottesmanbacteria bacterium RIFCSPHIGHO2_02_FULL_39_11 TaxID=1798382 RepID=A0A1F5ZUD0_9BACT|nr:MAG: hypothetical protein A3D77_02075 [Candidatus Gottesmanbacteria bacterium RIFCSPHIGHO2_02_FULL_39_11]